MMAGEAYLLPFSQVDDQELQDEINDLNFNMDQVDVVNQLTSLKNVQNSSLNSNELLGYLDKLYSSLHQSKLDYSLLVDSDPDVNILNKHYDGISNKLLKLTKNILSKPLTLIINQMITTGIFPDSFKKSKIISIFKKGDQSLLINYRPISLLPTISKVFERIIFDQMYHYINSNNLLAEQQYGFRKKTFYGICCRKVG